MLAGTTADGADIACPTIRLPYNGFTYSAVVSMPAGNWSAELVDGQRALDSAAGPVPLGEALAACRRAVTAALSPGAVLQPSDAPIELYLPR